MRRRLQCQEQDIYTCPEQDIRERGRQQIKPQSKSTNRTRGKPLHGAKYRSQPAHAQSTEEEQMRDARTGQRGAGGATGAGWCEGVGGAT
jgi:hypothetical protein